MSELWLCGIEGLRAFGLQLSVEPLLGNSRILIRQLLDCKNDSILTALSWPQKIKERQCFLPIAVDALRT